MSYNFNSVQYSGGVKNGEGGGVIFKECVGQPIYCNNNNYQSLARVKKNMLFRFSALNFCELQKNHHSYNLKIYDLNNYRKPQAAPMIGNLSFNNTRTRKV